MLLLTSTSNLTSTTNFMTTNFMTTYSYFSLPYGFYREIYGVYMSTMSEGLLRVKHHMCDESTCVVIINYFQVLQIKGALIIHLVVVRGFYFKIYKKYKIY